MFQCLFAGHDGCGVVISSSQNHQQHQTHIILLCSWYSKVFINNYIMYYHKWYLWSGRSFNVFRSWRPPTLLQLRFRNLLVALSKPGSPHPPSAPTATPPPPTPATRPSTPPPPIPRHHLQLQGPRRLQTRMVGRRKATPSPKKFIPPKSIRKITVFPIMHVARPRPTKKSSYPP